MNKRKKPFLRLLSLVLASFLLFLPVAVSAAGDGETAAKSSIGAVGVDEDEPMRSGAFANWKQRDPRWYDQSLGYSSVGRSGCYVTSLSMILVASGLERERYEKGEFNPGIFAAELKEAGLISSGGGLDLDGYVASEAGLAIDERIDGADFDPLPQPEKARLIQDQLNAGRFVFIIAHNPTTGNRHAVVASAVENGEVLVCDPGYTSKTGLLFEDYPSVSEIIVFAADVEECEDSEKNFGSDIPSALAVSASSLWNDLSGI